MSSRERTRRPGPRVARQIAAARGSGSRLARGSDEGSDFKSAPARASVRSTAPARCRDEQSPRPDGHNGTLPRSRCLQALDLRRKIMSLISIKSRADLPRQLHPLWGQDAKLRCVREPSRRDGGRTGRPSSNTCGACSRELAGGGRTPQAHSPAMPSHRLRAQQVHVLRLPPRRRSWPCRASRRRVSPSFWTTRTTRSWTRSRKLVVEYAIAVTQQLGNRTRDEMFVRLRQHFTEAQIVEMTWRTARRGAFNRFNDILQLEIEQGKEVRDAAE